MDAEAETTNTGPRFYPVSGDGDEAELRKLRAKAALADELAEWTIGLDYTNNSIPTNGVLSHTKGHILKGVDLARRIKEMG